MNERALVALGLLAAVASRSGPERALASLHGKLRDLQAREPANAIVATVLGAAAAFYLAERGQNPKVNSYHDALVYVSTNLSVGYSDIFAKTPAGKLIGTALMTYGPALAARALDPPAAVDAGEAASSALLEKLDAILLELQKARP